MASVPAQAGETLIIWTQPSLGAIADSADITGWWLYYAPDKKKRMYRANKRIDVGYLVPCWAEECPPLLDGSPATEPCYTVLFAELGLAAGAWCFKARGYDAAGRLSNFTEEFCGVF